MFSLQQHNQVLFHLSQLTSARTPKQPHLSKKSFNKIEADLNPIFQADSFEKALLAVKEIGLFDTLPKTFQPKKWVFGEKVTMITRGGARVRAEFLGTSPSQLTHLPGGLPHTLNVQVRYFKTERAMQAEVVRSPGIFQRLRHAMGFERTPPNKPLDQATLSEAEADPSFIKT